MPFMRLVLPLVMICLSMHDAIVSANGAEARHPLEHLNAGLEAQSPHRPATLQALNRRPTSRPTRRPTRRPSKKPSRSPRKPTRAPTKRKLPTSTPTRKPPTASAPFSSAATGNVPKTSTKRGLVVTPSSGLPDQLNAAWYYTYNINGYTQVKAAFVPMLRAASDMSRLSFTNGPLLAFNEPDFSSGARLTPQQALAIWPAMEKKSKQLSSPACSRKYTFTWQPVFMAGTSKYKPRVDYMAVHWYQSNARDFITFIETIHNLWGRPIWVTEFAMADWSATTRPSTYGDADVINFLRIVIPYLESKPYVQRYSYYSDNHYNAIKFSSLWTSNKQPNALGKFYSGLSSSSAKVASFSNVTNNDGLPRISLSQQTSTSAIALFILVPLCCVSVFAAVFAWYQYGRSRDSPEPTNELTEDVV